jgi:molecular chaperone GrpE
MFAMSSDCNNLPTEEEKNMSSEESPLNASDSQPLNQNTDQNETTVEVVVDEPTAKIEELEARVKEEQDKAMRAQAEMINFRKRQEKERSTWNQMAIKDVISAFLDPLDNLERSVEAASASEGDERVNSLVEGVKMVIQQINEVLDRKNVVALNPKGELFNPNEHEAYGQIESSEVEEGHVVNVFRKGYKIGDQLIRTATVQIAKKPASN